MTLRQLPASSVVRLIGDDQGRLEAVEASDVGLDARHLHGVRPVRRPAGSDHAMIDTESAERPARLVHKLLPMDEDDDRVTLCARPLRDERKQDGFPRAGRTDDERAPFAGSVGVAHAIH